MIVTCVILIVLIMTAILNLGLFNSMGIGYRDGKNVIRRFIDNDISFDELFLILYLFVLCAF